MAETNAPPTIQEVLLIRNDLEEFSSTMDRTVASYITDSLAECKRILEDDRGVTWSRVFSTDDDAYLDNSDSTGRNEDRIKNAISHMTAAMVFRDYTVTQRLDEEDSTWVSLADYHEQKAMVRLLKSRLDIDTDDSGAVDTDEEGLLGQAFMVK